MSLAAAIVANLPKETSGPRSSNSFQFQRSWALCRLIELHTASADYLIAFDYHDDVVVLDNSAVPQAVAFYQVKSKRKGNWSATNLISRTKGKKGLKASILGKLYGHRVTFANHSTSLTFVSNAPFKIKMASGPQSHDRESFSLSEVLGSELSKLKAKLEKECNQSSIADDTTIFLLHTAMSADGHEAYTKGRVADFLESRGHTDIRPIPFYQTMASEVERRNNCELSLVTFADFCKHKSLSRADVDRILALLKPKKEIDILVNEICAQLRAESYPSPQIAGLASKCRQCVLDRLDPSNSLLENASAAIRDLLKKSGSPSELLGRPLAQSIEIVLAATSEAVCEAKRHYGVDYLKALAIVIHYDAATEPTTLDPQLADKTP